MIILFIDGETNLKSSQSEFHYYFQHDIITWVSIHFEVGVWVSQTKGSNIILPFMRANE